MRNNTHDEWAEMLLHGDVMDKTMQAMVDDPPLLDIRGKDDRDNMFAIVGEVTGKIGHATRVYAKKCLGYLAWKVKRFTKKRPAGL